MNPKIGKAAEEVTAVVAASKEVERPLAAIARAKQQPIQRKSNRVAMELVEVAPALGKPNEAEAVDLEDVGLE